MARKRGGRVEGDEGEGDVGREEEGKSFGQVIVPAVRAVEDGERLGDVEVEPLVGREGPDAEVETVRDGGDGEGKGSV